MKKKLLSCLLAAAMTFSAASMGVSAATIDQDSDPQSAVTQISTQVPMSYIVTIPENTTISFNDTETEFGAVELTAAQLEVGKSVTVTVQPGALANTDDQTKTIPYTVMAGEEEFTGAEYTAEGQSTDLTLAVAQADWNSAYAGSYQGTVTFTVAYGDSTGA